MQNELGTNEVYIRDSSDGFQHGQVLGVLAKLGFYGATPVVQPSSPGGNTHTPSAGATTSLFVNTTFDGGVTGSNYTVGDVVAALKKLGLIAT